MGKLVKRPIGMWLIQVEKSMLFMPSPFPQIVYTSWERQGEKFVEISGRNYV
jgi:hypothetical protein